ncbi:hypothetical protein NC651_034339 [Populus alba x Populus x berolinensis]|nr:hypothetical protein NC651_034322 [Populus alba x Populus x berolinensis]KAJ6869571.1 hypothetical protein NC651_034339 [Populus alba x Populus x berolinensis]
MITTSKLTPKNMGDSGLLSLVFILLQILLVP